jgi:DNA modification methylase
MTTLHQGDVRDVLPTLDAELVQCVVTSPPYWGLRDYGVDGQIGLEPTPDAYVQTLVAVFREIKRVLRDDGTVWLNLGDSYAASGPAGGAGKQHTNVGSVGVPVRKPPLGLKPKDLVGIPWRVAFALQADGWYLRSDIIWAKGVSFCPSYSGSVMPESVTDRPTKSHEYLFLLTKSPRYYYDADAVRENWADDRNGAANGQNWDRPETQTAYTRRPQLAPKTTGRNLRSVWTINPQPFSEAHFATFPTALVEPCVKAGSAKGDLVLDPFAGSGTVGCVALKLGRTFVGIELNPVYCTMANESIDGPLFA